MRSRDEAGEEADVRRDEAHGNFPGAEDCTGGADEQQQERGGGLQPGLGIEKLLKRF